MRKTLLYLRQFWHGGWSIPAGLRILVRFVWLWFPHPQVYNMFSFIFPSIHVDLKTWAEQFEWGQCRVLAILRKVNSFWLAGNVWSWDTFSGIEKQSEETRRRTHTKFLTIEKQLQAGEACKDRSNFLKLDTDRYSQLQSLRRFRTQVGIPVWHKQLCHVVPCCTIHNSYILITDICMYVICDIIIWHDDGIILSTSLLIGLFKIDAQFWHITSNSHVK